MRSPAEQAGVRPRTCTVLSLRAGRRRPDLRLFAERRATWPAAWLDRRAALQTLRRLKPIGAHAGVAVFRAATQFAKMCDAREFGLKPVVRSAQLAFAVIAVGRSRVQAFVRRG